MCSLNSRTCSRAAIIRRRTRGAAAIMVPWGIVLLLLIANAPAAQTKAAQSIEQKIEAGGKGYIQTGTGKMYITNIQGIPPAEYNRLVAEMGVTQAALKNFFTTLEQKQVPAEQLDATLRAMADQFRALRAELIAFKSSDPDVAESKREAAAALDKGDFDRVESFLERARAADLEAARRMHEAAEQRRRSAAASTYELGNLKATQLAYADAARYYREAADTLPAADEQKRAEYLNSSGSAARNAGLYPMAQKALEEALALRRKALHPEHADVAQSLSNLALIYETQDHFTEAETCLLEARDIYKKVVGPQHAYAAITFNNLAELYRAQGRYSEAEPLYEEALAIFKQAGSQDHDTATVLGNLASLYLGQRRYREAEPLLTKALAIYKKVLSPVHPDTAQLVNSLGALYQAKRQYSKAELYYGDALAIRIQALGPEHTLTAQSLNNLATLYYDQGRYLEAEQLHKKALAIRTHVLGPKHSDTAHSLNNLATVYYALRRFPEAEHHFKGALTIYVKVFGPTHPSTANVRGNLLKLYRHLGRTTEAKALELEAVPLESEVAP